MAGILLPLPLAIGCGHGDSLEMVTDLVEELPFAEVRCEPTTIDLGTPEGRRSLIRGWYDDERSARTGRDFVWTRGERSEVEFHLARPRDLGVTITVSPFAAPRIPDQVLTVTLDEHEVAEFRLRHGWQDYTITAPADFLHAGTNRLAFLPAHVWVPADVQEDSEDRRRLAVAVDEIRFDGTLDSASGVSVDADQTLSIPAGCVADWYVDPPPMSAFMMGAIRLEGGDSVTLHFSARRDLHPNVPLASVDQARRTMRIDLPSSAGPLDLRIETVADTAAGPTPKATIQRPRIMTEHPPGGGQQPAPPTAPPAVDPGSRPNVIVYLVDALRADSLGCYGADHGASPRIDDFAAGATVFEDAVAQSSWTKASVASIFTGMWPPGHGVHGPHDRLPDDLETMPELLREAGYHTCAVVANAYVGRSFGFDRGFDHFEFLKHTVGDSSVIHSHVTGWLDGVPAGEPFFLYVHTVDPHAPYAPPEEFRRRFADHVRDPESGGVSTVRALAQGQRTASERLTDDLRALYAAEVAFNDFNFGRLVDELRERGSLQRSLIIFLSDHGEAFGEHGAWTHGLDLHAESLRIPLVVRFPHGRNGGLRVGHTVQQADILPTVLAAAGLVLPERLDGEDLSAFVERPVDRALLCQLDYWGRRGVALLLGRWKLIRPLSEEFGSAVQLYDRVSDPRERRDLAGDLPVRTGFLGELLVRQLARARAPVEIKVDAGTRDELRALGYIE